MKTLDKQSVFPEVQTASDRKSVAGTRANLYPCNTALRDTLRAIENTLHADPENGA